LELIFALVTFLGTTLRFAQILNRDRRGDVRARFLVPILCCALGLDGCAGLPPLEEATGGIPVREIVLRVKCELADAFMLGEPGEPGWWLTDQPNFAWMKDWITESDLTLEILYTAGFSPGVTLKQPLFNG
jgi:hypothetical protein